MPGKLQDPAFSLPSTLGAAFEIIATRGQAGFTGM
ncbi:hypothetical protein IWX87_001299 [Polaromonas sp. CG_9.7]|nr:hypothetical protein [Polaromonas sp. CG_9.7]MBG6113547.1 hypothetical protein [Polaromonas sp. CG_9.2]